MVARLSAGPFVAGALLALLTSASVHAQPAPGDPGPSVLVVGERTPFLELLEAELALLELELTPGHAGAPRDEAEADARMREWDARAMVVVADGVVVRLRGCDGALRRASFPLDDAPGRTSLLVAETLFAHAQTRCAPVAPPGAAETVADAAWTRPPPVLAREAAPPVAPAPLDASPDRAPPSRLSLALELGAVRDREGTFGGALGAAAQLALHPHLHARVGVRGALTDATAVLGELGLGVAVGERWRWAAGGGFALAWSRLEVQPAGQPGTPSLVVRTLAPGYYLASSLERRIGAWGVGLRLAFVQTRRAGRYEAGEPARRLGPWTSAALRLTRQL